MGGCVLLWEQVLRAVFRGRLWGCLVKRLWWTVLGPVPADVFLRWVVLCPALVNGSAGGAGEDGCE